jgi:flagellar FliL protein
MAEPEREEEDGEEAAAPPASKLTGGIVGTLINAVGIFVLCLAAVVVGGIINGKLTHPTEYRLDKDGSIKPVLPVPPPEPKKSEAAPPAEAAKPPAPALYLKMDPQLVVNFDSTSEVKFLAIDIDFMARDQAVLDDVQRNMPKIRNNLLMLISNRDYRTLMTREGKDKLRLEALEETKRVLKQETGSAKLEDLFFTSFVVQ